MFRQRCIIISGLFYFLLMVSMEISAENYTYYDSVNHYTLTLPDGWEKIPKVMIDREVNRAVGQLQGKSDFVEFDAGFHLKGKNYFEYPYVLIQNWEGNTPAYNQIEKELAGDESKAEFEKTAKRYEHLVSSATAENPYLDRGRNMIFVNAEVDVQGIGRVKSLTTICLGRHGTVRVYFYSLESEYSHNLSIFMSILDSFNMIKGMNITNLKWGIIIRKEYWMVY